MSLELGGVEDGGKCGGFIPLGDVGLVVGNVPAVVVKGDCGARVVRLCEFNLELLGVGVHMGDRALPPFQGVLGPIRHGLV
jgi:hypothetical protein